MPIELRIQSGARAGQTQSFDKSVIAIGRHPMSDLRFDANNDLDVSTRHGEIRPLDGRYIVNDNDSTNGTFVNGERLPRGGSRGLTTGDVIAFGSRAERLGGDRRRRADQCAERPQLGVDAAQIATAPAGAPKKRIGTSERVASAVHEQTRI